MNYTELQVTSNFSFLRGASHPRELVDEAIRLGYTTIGITDRNTLAGVVRAYAATKGKAIRLVVGARLDLLDGLSLLAYPTNKAAYSRLSNLLTVGNLRAEKGECHLYKTDVYEYKEGIIFIAIPPVSLNQHFDFEPSFSVALEEYKGAFGDALYLAASRRYGGDDSKQLFRLSALSTEVGIPLLATNDVHYHNKGRRQLQDVVTCVREGCTIYNAGFKLHPNAERYLKPGEEMQRLFRKYPDAIRRTQEIAEACTFSLSELQYEYPEEITTQGQTPQEELTKLAWKGANEIFGEPLPEKTINAIKHELQFIEQMNYAAYFLTVYDIVRFARSRGILCQGRGSAANSTVCFCLGITSVNPEKFDLLFERFLSAARNEPPDIDVDFEHERREEVMQYVFQKYGRDRAAVVATVTQVHSKGAIRDVGKAMGLTDDVLDKLSGSVAWFDDGFDEARIREAGFSPADTHFKKVLQLTHQYMGFPRQLGQHTGGFVITKGKLSDLCPVMNARMEARTNIEWNKDDIDALGFMKIDVLALGMLTCIRKAFDSLQNHHGIEHTLASVPQDDPVVYEMIQHADTIGVFQIESRAQQSMLPRLKPKCFYDLVIEVAIVRPGPIQGDMVHPYLRRRNGEEPIEYPSKDLEEILGRTLGVPLFQEQAMKIAIVAAGFTPVEADELRRSMATFKVHGMVKKFEDKLITGMKERGYTEEYAKRVFRQLEGFGSYGFPESHAASFAQLVYVSCWLKCHYPDVFAAAVLNSLPMGFYQPAQIVQDARKHGVKIRPVDVNHSQWDCTLEEKDGESRALRLGFRQVKSLRADNVHVLVEKRTSSFATVNDLRDAGVPQTALEILADADAFRSMGLDRRQALWEVSTKDHSQQLFQGQAPADAVGEGVQLPLMLPSEHVVQDYATTSLSIKAHPVGFVRHKLQDLGVYTANMLSKLTNGQPVKVAGLVLVRQRPGTAKGVCFMTVEDETGFANLVVFPNVFAFYRKAVLSAQLFMAEGSVQIEGEVVHVIVQACHDVSGLLRGLIAAEGDNPQLLTLARADEKVPPKDKRVEQQTKLFAEVRNFK